METKTINADITETCEPDAEQSASGSHVYTIYCHTHRESGRRYIGLTKKTMLKRWHRHVYEAKRSVKGYNHFYNAIRSYGPESFDHEILQKCHTLEEANAAEIYWIDLYDTRNPIRGFNIARGGSHTPHPVKNPWDRPEFVEKARLMNNIRHCFTPEARAKQLESLRSPESRAKRSELARRSLSNPETVAKREAMRARPEYSQKISEATKKALSDPEIYRRFMEGAAAIRTPELYERIGKSIKKAFEDPEVQERHRAATKLAQNRPEVKAKAKNRKISDETRAKISAASTGFQHTDDSKERMRQLFLERRERLLAESGFSSWSEYIGHKIKSSKNI